MAKGRKSRNNESNMTSQKKAAELIEKHRAEKEAKIKEENEAIVMQDALVQEKIKEYEEMKNELEMKAVEQELELEESRSKLEQEFAELSARKAVIEKQQSQLQEERLLLENEIETLRVQTIEDAIQKVKSDEQSIRIKEKDSLYSEWEKDKAEQKEKLNQYINDKKMAIEVELSEAHKLKLSAIDTRNEMIRTMNEKLESEQEKLSEEYRNKLEECLKTKAEYKRKLEDLEEEKIEFEDEKEYVKELREKFSGYSETIVLKLKDEIRYLEEVSTISQQRIKDLTEKNAQMQIHLLDDNGASLIKHINELEEKLAESIKRNDAIANMPSNEEIMRLRECSKELEMRNEELEEERQKRYHAESKLNSYSMSMIELENARVSASALEALNQQLQDKLRFISEQYKSTQESKFPSLLEIDREVSKGAVPFGAKFNESLYGLVKYIRNYGANRKNALYYSEETIRVFLASLAASEPASRLLILQGLSGTGKSSLPTLVGEAFNIECKLVSVQPSWRDNRELLGYDNDFTNRFKETEFTKFLYEATAVPNQNRIWFIVLDEMNLARIEYYFADFLSVLEKEESKWIIPLVSSFSEPDESQRPKYLNYDNAAANICITKNVWFIGTANNDDSTSLITDKVYDRAQVLDMDEREEAFNGERVNQITLGLDELLAYFDSAKSKNENNMTKNDWDKIKEMDELYLKNMGITFGNRIQRQMESFVPVYVECGGTKEGAIDYLLTHKILRKLDERYEPYLVESLKEFKEFLADQYGENTFSYSVKKINKLIEKINPGDTDAY